MELNCPCCGNKLNVELHPVSNLSDLGAPGKPAESEYAQLRPCVAPQPVVAPLPEVKPKFRVSTDTGKFRQALHDAGFDQAATDGIIYNDPRDGGNRLKLYFARSIVDASDEQLDKLKACLGEQFGDRLQMSRIHYGASFRGITTSYTVYLTK